MMDMVRFIICDRRVLTMALTDVTFSDAGNIVHTRHVSCPREGANSACFLTVEDGKEWAVEKLTTKRIALMRNVDDIDAALSSLREIS